MLSCFPDLDNGEAQQKNNMKRFSYICFKKNCYFEFSTFSLSNLISLLLVVTHTQKKNYGKESWNKSN